MYIYVYTFHVRLPILIITHCCVRSRVFRISVSPEIKLRTPVDVVVVFI